MSTLLGVDAWLNPDTLQLCKHSLFTVWYRTLQTYKEEVRIEALTSRPTQIFFYCKKNDLRFLKMATDMMAFIVFLRHVFFFLLPPWQKVVMFLVAFVCLS